jgi:hypothetical protein
MKSLPKQVDPSNAVKLTLAASLVNKRKSPPAGADGQVLE